MFLLEVEQDAAVIKLLTWNCNLPRSKWPWYLYIRLKKCLLVSDLLEFCPFPVCLGSVQDTEHQRDWLRRSSKLEGWTGESQLQPH